MIKTYVVGGDSNYANFIDNVEFVDNLEDAKLVIFTGGSDVTPSFYGCKKFSKTYSNLERDQEERAIFEKINPKTQVCYGACRGSQFLCVMNDGKLVQDINHHATGATHEITDGEKIYMITSTHHQMQYPFDLDPNDYNLLFTSYGVESDYYDGDQIDYDEICGREPEIVLYHKENKPKCLAVQGHPEMIPNSPVAKMINELIIKLVNASN